METNNIPKVYQCISAVSADLAHSGIAKSRNNQQQGYKFRGIDDVYNALAPVLAKHGLIIIPRIMSREVTERATKSGSLMNCVTVEAEFDFIAAADGTMVTSRAYGEAQDSADKATNKAMSAAYKYTAMQTFCIPTEGDNDADAATPEPIAAEGRFREPQPAASRPAPASGVRVESVRAAKKGEKDGKAWTLYIVKLTDGNEYKTFEDDVAANASSAERSGNPVAFQFEDTDRGRKLSSIEEIA
jgi:hypothetical protein